MTQHSWPRSMVVSALAMAALQCLDARAQSSDTPPAAPDAAKSAGLDLNTVVITGTSAGVSKMKSSISVSTIDGDQVKANQAQNASDVLTSIPGLFVQSSGGAGNANASVRGLPISAGGSRYLQFQEDGLPVLLFGDIAFATPDTFLRVDTTLDRVEAVRGGTGSTLTTNGPGGLVNFITKTGEEPGGSIALSAGLGYRDERLDFGYGNKLAEKTRFFIGGFYDTGAGPRENSNSAIRGGQVKANLTQEFDNGYIRLSLKHLSDQQPLYMPAPVSIVNGQINTLPGIDPRTYTGYSSNWVADSVLTASNGHDAIDVNKGQTALSNALGLEGKFTLAGGWTLDEKFRVAHNSGQWSGFFPGSAVAPAPAGTTFATGGAAGQGYAGPAFQNVVFDVSLNNLNATTNDLKFSRTFDQVAGGKITAGAGLFLDIQHVGLTWNFNNYFMQATGSNPALLNSPGLTTTSFGLIGPAFGGCCSRDIDAEYRTNAPYVFGSYEAGPLTVDGSVRRDSQHASGSYNLATAATTGGPLAYQSGAAVPIDYTVHHTEYSLGANYLLNRDLALFARISDGAAFNADRIMFNGPLSGGVPIPINTVRQYEAGVKWRTRELSTFVTVFDARTSESNYSATLQQQSANTYDSHGVELEAGYHWGDFHLSAGATYTSSNTSASTNPALVGQPANRQAKLIYQFGPGYTTEKIDLGLAITGTTNSKEVDVSPFITLPAYTIVNAHASYRFDAHTSLSFGVYNLFDTLAYTEVDSTYTARALNRRNAHLTLTYQF